MCVTAMEGVTCVQIMTIKAGVRPWLLTVLLSLPGGRPGRQWEGSFSTDLHLSEARRMNRTWPGKVHEKEAQDTREPRQAVELRAAWGGASVLEGWAGSKTSTT